MGFALTFSQKLNPLHKALVFFKKHFLVITGLGLLAAFGRVIQLGGFGTISRGLNIFLEVVVESARISLFLYVLGVADIRKGVLRIRRFFTEKENRKVRWATFMQNIRRQWGSILVNMVGFALIVWTLNYLIDLLAYETCLYLTLREDGILDASSSEWTILLFFKNLSVIPFTLVFETVLLLWLVNQSGRDKPNAVNVPNLS
jgi:preprotein translocase subunit SecE